MFTSLVGLLGVRNWGGLGWYLLGRWGLPTNSSHVSAVLGFPLDVKCYIDG